jgi:hypothetical protein
MPVNNPVKIKTKKVSERQLARKAVIAERKLDRIKARKAAKSQRKQIDKQRAKIFNETHAFLSEVHDVLVQHGEEKL